jgi:hypothetical protein
VFTRKKGGVAHVAEILRWRGNEVVRRPGCLRGLRLLGNEQMKKSEQIKTKECKHVVRPV